MRVKFLIALLGALFVLTTPAHAQDTPKKVFKIGWAQDPQTLNPFVDYDEEDFRIWSVSPRAGRSRPTRRRSRSTS
jgi:hypothetical protein